MVRLIKWVLTLAIVAAAAWSAWWYLGAKGQETGLQAWLDAQRKRGWQAEAAEISVTGYPTAFNLAAREIRLADPKTGWSWQAEDLYANSDPTTPTRIAVTWPDTQALATPVDRAAISSQLMETVLDLRPGPSMELREAATQIEALRVTGRSGWKAGAKAVDVNLAERPADLGPPNSYDLRVVGDKLALPKEIVAQIDPTGWLKPSVERLTVAAHGTFDAPLDRTTVEDGKLALRGATIREAGFEWGEMRVVLKGSFQTNDDGYPEGSIDLEVAQWRQMLRLAQRSGVIDRGTADTIQSGIEFYTSLVGGGEDLKAPLGLSGGKVKLGPFAIADAPRLAPPR